MSDKIKDFKKTEIEVKTPFTDDVVKKVPVLETEKSQYKQNLTTTDAQDFIVLNTATHGVIDIEMPAYQRRNVRSRDIVMVKQGSFFEVDSKGNRVRSARESVDILFEVKDGQELVNFTSSGFSSSGRRYYCVIENGEVISAVRGPLNWNEVSVSVLNEIESSLLHDNYSAAAAITAAKIDMLIASGQSEAQIKALKENGAKLKTISGTEEEWNRLIGVLPPLVEKESSPEPASRTVIK